MYKSKKTPKAKNKNVRKVVHIVFDILWTFVVTGGFHFKGKTFQQRIQEIEKKEKKR